MTDVSEDLIEKEVKKKKISGKSCVAYGCYHRSGEDAKNHGVTFHSFPWSKPEIVRKWERAMHRKAFEASIHSRVCSNHFTPDCFDRTGHRVQLKAGSLPTIFDLPGHPVKRVRQEKPPAEGNVCGLTSPKALMPTTSLSDERCSAPVLEPSQGCLRNDGSANGAKTVCATPEGIRKKTVIIVGNKTAASEGIINKIIVRTKTAAAEEGIGNKTIVGIKTAASEGISNKIIVRTKTSASGGISKKTISPPSYIMSNWHNYCLPCPKVLKQHFSLMQSALTQFQHKVKILRQKNRRLQSKVESLQQKLSKREQKDFV